MGLLSYCDLSEQANLCFKDGAKVVFSDAKNLPPNLDFSCCDRIDLYSCDLSEQSHLRFRSNAKVDLRDTYNLPENLDVSMCAEVDLTDCDLSAVKKLVFKNRQQMEDSCAELPDDWTGKLVFADEERQKTSSSLGLAMSVKTNDGR